MASTSMGLSRFELTDYSRLRDAIYTFLALPWMFFIGLLPDVLLAFTFLRAITVELLMPQCRRYLSEFAMWPAQDRMRQRMDSSSYEETCRSVASALHSAASSNAEQQGGGAASHGPGRVLLQLPRATAEQQLAVAAALATTMGAALLPVDLDLLGQLVALPTKGLGLLTAPTLADRGARDILSYMRSVFFYGGRLQFSMDILRRASEEMAQICPVLVFVPDVEDTLCAHPACNLSFRRTFGLDHPRGAPALLPGAGAAAPGEKPIVIVGATSLPSPTPGLIPGAKVYEIAEGSSVWAAVRAGREDAPRLERPPPGDRDAAMGALASLLAAGQSGPALSSLLTSALQNALALRGGEEAPALPRLEGRQYGYSSTGQPIAATAPQIEYGDMAAEESRALVPPPPPPPPAQLHHPHPHPLAFPRPSDLGRVQQKLDEKEALVDAAREQLNVQRARHKAAIKALEHVQAENSALRAMATESQGLADRVHKENGELLDMVSQQHELVNTQQARAQAAEREVQRLLNEQAILRSALQESYDPEDVEKKVVVVAQGGLASRLEGMQKSISLNT